MKRVRKSVLIGAIAIVGLLVWALRPSPVAVDVEGVERGALQVTVDEEGRTRVRDRYVVSSPVPGRVQRITLEPGDPVEAGGVVALFHPADPALIDARTRAEMEARVRAAEAALGSARAEHERLRAELDFARKDLARYQGLVEAGAAPRERLEAAERLVRTLEQAVESAEFGGRTAEHQLEVARASLLPPDGRRGDGAAVRLQSPIDGVVLRRLQESEAVVPLGHPLLELGQLDRLEIVADVLSTAAVRVAADQRVLIEQWGGDATLAGRVRRVEPSGFTKISALGVEEQRVNVVIDFENAHHAIPGLGDGYRVEVRVIVWERDEVLKVPVSALFRDGERWAVYRLENGRAAQRIVEIGQRTGLEAEVLGGLDAGDRVVVYPGDNVRDGVRVVERD